MVDVDLKTFIKLYNEDKAFNPGKPPRIFLRKNSSFTSLKYKSSDFIYKAIVKNDELNDSKVALLNFGNNIVRL